MENLSFRDSLVAQMVKNLHVMQETWVQSLGQEDPLEEGMANPNQHSCLENSMDNGAWWTTVHGVTKSQTWLSIPPYIQMFGYFHIYSIFLFWHKCLVKFFHCTWLLVFFFFFLYIYLGFLSIYFRRESCVNFILPELSKVFVKPRTSDMQMIPL